MKHPIPHIIHLDDLITKALGRDNLFSQLKKTQIETHKKNHKRTLTMTDVKVEFSKSVTSTMPIMKKAIATISE